MNPVVTVTRVALNNFQRLAGRTTAATSQGFALGRPARFGGYQVPSQDHPSPADGVGRVEGLRQHVDCAAVDLGNRCTAEQLLDLLPDLVEVDNGRLGIGDLLTQIGQPPEQSLRAEDVLEEPDEIPEPDELAEHLIERRRRPRPLMARRWTLRLPASASMVRIHPATAVPPQKYSMTRCTNVPKSETMSCTTLTPQPSQDLITPSNQLPRSWARVMNAPMAVISPGIGSLQSIPARVVAHAVGVATGAVIPNGRDLVQVDACQVLEHRSASSGEAAQQAADGAAHPRAR